MIQKLVRSSTFAVLFCAAFSLRAFAAAAGAPVYPNATNRNPDLPVGSPMFQLETSDAAAKVDAWYGAHLPKGCTHQTAQGGAKYACPGVNIMITPDGGKTLITHMSPMGGMLGH